MIILDVNGGGDKLVQPFERSVRFSRLLHGSGSYCARPSYVSIEGYYLSWIMMESSGLAEDDDYFRCVRLKVAEPGS